MIAEPIFRQYAHIGVGVCCGGKSEYSDNDYIFDYKKRHSAFPHETTIDQLFTEEQFEAYRALGFHAAYGVFSGTDWYAFLDLDEDRAAWPNVAVLRGLFGRIAVAPPTV